MSVTSITKEELKQKLEKGEPVQVVNVLDPKHYNMGLIKGSKKIPLDDLNKRVGELDKATEVVTYCANTQCTASSEAAKQLQAQGFHVKAYEGGIQEWKQAGYPTEEPDACGSGTSKGSSCCG